RSGVPSDGVLDGRNGASRPPRPRGRRHAREEGDQTDREDTHQIGERRVAAKACEIWRAVGRGTRPRGPLIHPPGGWVILAALCPATTGAEPGSRGFRVNLKASYPELRAS